MYKKIIICQTCNGNVRTRKQVCRKCGGTGWIGKRADTIVSCNSCYGNGEVKIHGCKNCKGRGSI
jgi:DnaJ-class molecular chaperone